MNQAEGGRWLQKGMNFRPNAPNSVFLMSRRKNALYADHIDSDGTVLVYEGHDFKADEEHPDPKLVDQPLRLADGRVTDNGKFYAAAKEAAAGAAAHRVNVYEKIRTNIWTFKGTFELVDAWQESDGKRMVCKFKLHLVQRDLGLAPVEHSRVIPSEVLAAVWERDQGKCRLCGATDNLHFDHILPFSKGGTSLTKENVQLLCVRHNLEKGARIG